MFKTVTDCDWRIRATVTGTVTIWVPFAFKHEAGPGGQKQPELEQLVHVSMRLQKADFFA